MSQIAILTDPTQTTSWADDVARAADSNKRALGFLPKSRYREACESGRIFVALCDTATGHEYAGHVMFSGTGSELHIQQLVVNDKLRRRGIARNLVEELVCWAESRNYLGMAIRVAVDLRSSNQAWDRLGFELVKTVKGRGSSKRLINLRHRELRSQSLLQFVQAVGKDNVAFSVPPNVGRGVPTYVVDLNVYFDCLKDRSRRPAAQALFRAAFSTLFRLVITNEFPRELERHTSTDPSKADPILELARTLPVLPYEPQPGDDDLTRNLADRIFPGRSKNGSLRDRDRSDIAHLVIAVRSRATGFVTSERAMLLQRDWLRETYGTDIVPVEEIADYLKDATPSVQGRPTSNVSAPSFEVFDPTSNEAGALVQFLEATDTPPVIRQKLTSWLSRPDNQRVVAARTSKGLAAVLAWRLLTGPPRQLEAVLVLAPENEAAPAIVDFLTETMIHDTSAPSVARVDLSTSMLPDALQQVLQEHGFTKDATTGWTKIAAGRHVNAALWPRLAHDVRSLCGLALPTSLMSEKFAYSKRITSILDDGRTWIGSLDDLEGLLSPIMLAFPDRPATVIPIRATFADGLFGHLRQANLFCQPIASFRRERVYYTASRSFGLFERGHLLLFYESAAGHGRAAVVAMARSLGARTLLKAELQAATLSRGVLDVKELEHLGVRPTVTAVSFDNVIVLPKPVTLEQLRAHNWVPGTNFVTATRISGETARQILDLGHPA